MRDACGGPSVGGNTPPPLDVNIVLDVEDNLWTMNEKVREATTGLTYNETLTSLLKVSQRACAQIWIFDASVSPGCWKQWSLSRW